MRRIKDIEAIESDSFVPQAFKSSRDDTKVRSVSLFPPAPHSLYLFTLPLIEFPSLQCWAVCPETAQAKSNIPIQRRLFQPETVSSGAPLFASKAAAPTQKPQQATAILCLLLPFSLPPSGCVDEEKHRSHY